MKKLIPLALAFLMIILSGCKDEDETTLGVIELNKTELELTIEDEFQFEVNVLMSGLEIPEYKWYLGHPGVQEEVPAILFSFDQTGKIKANKDGVSALTVESVGRYTKQGKPYTSTCIITIHPIEATFIYFEQEVYEAKIGNKFELNVIFKPENTTYKNLKWESSNENIATVEKGIVTITGTGEVTITATLEDSELKATCKILVTE